MPTQARIDICNISCDNLCRHSGDPGRCMGRCLPPCLRPLRAGGCRHPLPFPIPHQAKIHGPSRRPPAATEIMYVQ